LGKIRLTSPLGLPSSIRCMGIRIHPEANADPLPSQGLGIDIPETAAMICRTTT
jgi:hypothetical protein